MGKTYSIMREEYLSFMPSLACHIGVEGAIVVQKIAFLLNCPNSGCTIDGHKWVWNTLDDWQKNFFPFWSKRTIQRIFKTLSTDWGVLVSCSPKGEDRTKHYRLNEGVYEKLTLESVPDNPCGQVDHMAWTDCPHAIRAESTTESTKGCGTSVQHSGSGGFSDRNRRPYPTSEEEMYRLLEEADIEPNPDRDGKFYDQMSAAGWRIRGKPIADWMAAYKARVEHNEQACKRK